MKVKETSSFWICCSNGSAIPLYQHVRAEGKDFFTNKKEANKIIRRNVLNDWRPEENDIPA